MHGRRSARMRREALNGSDQHKKEVVGQRSDKGAHKPFNAGLGFIQGIELDAEPSVEQRKKRE